MAYFLKKNKKKGKVYLSIVNSYYDSSRKQTVHETYASYGTGQSLINDGISDPITYLEDKVKQLNHENNIKKSNQISKVAPFKYAGHFLVKGVLDKLNVEPIMNVYDLTSNFQFRLFDVMSALVYARSIKPCSKYKTYFEIIPYLEKEYSFSYDQLLEGLGYFGENYEKIVEIFTKLTKEKYGINTNLSYFYCPDFYFEIDREDEFRKMGLLLDANQIPIGMKLYPGNESEKPKIREVINELRKQNGIEGTIVQVADKGLNCARNIYEARINKDGYLFSKSCKQLPDVEKTWILLDNDYIEVKDDDGKIIYRVKECVDTFPYSFTNDEGKIVKFKVKEKRVVTYNPTLARKQLHEIEKLEKKAYELCLSHAKKEEYGKCSKYVNFTDKDGKKAKTSINKEKLEKDKQLCGYNMLITSEIDADMKDIYNIYHNLWRIDESFKMLESELDASSVFLKSKETISGHFLICYLSTLLMRLLQIYELNDQDSYQEIFKFIREFYFVRVGNKYINMATKSDFIINLSDLTKLPLTSAMITQKQYQKIMDYHW